MEYCKTCGGELVAFGDGGRYCPYCGNGYRRSADGNMAAPVRDMAHTDSGVNVYDENIGGVLEIRWQDEKYTHSGSGFLLGNEGYALTNTHVVTAEDGRSCGKVRVRVAGAETEATVLRLGDDRHGEGNGIDLAVLRLASLPRGAKPLHFADFSDVRNGERVFVIGNSLGHGTCITSGIVSDRRRTVNGKPLLMTDCAVNGGNSGGPIFNERGEVIGVIVSGIPDAEGMNFAIPCEDAQAFFRTGGEVKKMAGGGPLELPKAPPPPPKKAICPCPRCRGTNGIVQNGIFYCPDCDYEG